MTNRDAAINALREYQKASFIPSLTVLISYFDSTYPGFLDSWGGAVRGIRTDFLTSELKKLAGEKGMSYPTRAELNQILFDAGAKGVNLGEAVVAGVAQSGEQIAKAGLFGIGGGIALAVVVLAVLYLGSGAIARGRARAA